MVRTPHSGGMGFSSFFARSPSRYAIARHASVLQAPSALRYRFVLALQLGECCLQYGQLLLKLTDLRTLPRDVLCLSCCRFSADSGCPAARRRLRTVATMTEKQVQQLCEFHARFCTGTFSETDVSALLVLLRHKSRGGAILELANSIAHSERNSGLFFRRLKENHGVLSNLGQKSGVVRGGDIFSSGDFAKNLDDTFVRYGLQSLALPVYDLIFLSALSLLQGGTAKAGTEFGELTLELRGERFELRATTLVKTQGGEFSASFPIASVANQWIPVCNPRALISPRGPVRVAVVDSVPIIDGFKPFEVHIEREPAITKSDVQQLAALLGLTERANGVAYAPSNRQIMTLRYDGRRLTVLGLPDFFRLGSDYERVLKAARLILGACVYDDARAHWFLEGLEVAPDGFHCHWVGKASYACTHQA